jgi:hypothetical protein
MVINESVHGQVDGKKVAEIIDEIVAKEGGVS